MCTVTKEMVTRANEQLARKREEILQHCNISRDSIVMPVNVFGMKVYRKMPMERINQIYGEARKKAIEANGTKI